jgi:hypothetical protein
MLQTEAKRNIPLRFRGGFSGYNPFPQPRRTSFPAHDIANRGLLGHLPVYRQQDLFAGGSWVPSRSMLLNVVSQVEFIIPPVIVFLARQVQQDGGVDPVETSCRMQLPHVVERLMKQIAMGRKAWLFWCSVAGGEQIANM